LNKKPQIDDGIGDPGWELTLCLLFSWVFIGVTLVRGVQSAGKVAYFTALFPYAVLLIFLIRGLTLEGAWSGIVELLFEPKWEKLLEPKVYIMNELVCEI
jgi:solute carrier family 6 amino acid transporter-like protein 5/7/9/14